MSWSDFYLFCFLVGVVLSVFSFLAGAIHLPIPAKLHPHFHFHLPHFHGGGHGAWRMEVATAVSAERARRSAHFLVQRFHCARLPGVVWRHGLHADEVFACAHIFRRGHRHTGRRWPPAGSSCASWSSLLALPTSLCAKRIAASSARIGTVSMTIRENGTGEIIFPLGGGRRCSGARSEDGQPIEKGAEVVIERYEKGIAYVKRWEEFREIMSF